MPRRGLARHAEGLLDVARITVVAVLHGHGAAALVDEIEHRQVKAEAAAPRAAREDEREESHSTSTIPTNLAAAEPVFVAVTSIHVLALSSRNVTALIVHDPPTASTLPGR